MTPPQRVLFIPKWYPNPDDPQLGVFLREHAEALAEKVPLSLLYAYPDPELQEGHKLEFEKSRGFTELIVHYRARGSKAARSFRYLKAMLLGWRTLLRWEGKPDLLHAHILNRPAFFAYLIKLRYGLPFLISEQWSGFLDGRAERRSWTSRRATAFLLKRADGVSAVSQQLGRVLKAWGSFTDPWIIPNMTVDPGPPKPIPTEPFRFFNISDMVDSLKNLSGLIRSFRALQEERTEKVELHIVGGGRDERMIREYAEQEGLEQHQVRFYGRLPNEKVHALFPDMSTLVVNSLHETFSVVTVEALAHGRPVISSKCGGPEGILRDKEVGILYPKGDDTATKDAMHRVMDGIHAFRAEQLHHYALENYGKEVVRDRYIELYREALNPER